jgi:hypothetical protein
MNLNNTYRIYKWLYNKYHPEDKAMGLKPCINNLAHSLLQQGSEMRQRGSGAPPKATKDITISSSVDGRRARSDSIDNHLPPLLYKLVRLKH